MTTVPLGQAMELARENAALREENERLLSEAGYHEAKDVIEQLTAQRDGIARAIWEEAAKIAEGAKIEKWNGVSTRELWRAEMADGLAREFRIRAAALGPTP